MMFLPLEFVEWNAQQTTRGALRVMETDPHGLTLSLVAVCVVFGCLLILFGIYSLSGAIFSGKFSRREPSGAKPRAAKALACDPETAAAIALALEAETGAKDETRAAIALALHLYLTDQAHDTESGIITIRRTDASGWEDKSRNFRQLPKFKR